MYMTCVVTIGEDCTAYPSPYGISLVTTLNASSILTLTLATVALRHGIEVSLSKVVVWRSAAQQLLIQLFKFVDSRPDASQAFRHHSAKSTRNNNKADYSIRCLISSEVLCLERTTSRDDSNVI